MINSENFKLIKHLADIEDVNGHDIELNYGQWYDNQPTYDLRKPRLDKHGGFTITSYGARELALILGREFGVLDKDEDTIDRQVMDFTHIIVVGDINWPVERYHVYKDVRLVLPIKKNSFGTMEVSARLDMNEGVYFIPMAEYKKVENGLLCGKLFMNDWLAMKEVTRADELALKMFYWND
ncbi:MAG: hypothetical protein K5769_02750 [Pseudobutyrivibrio sp.]|nr:hypothetical protein [Pseudobutyrivibrio sp.]